MSAIEKVCDLKKDLKVKREQLRKNPHSLAMFNKKDIPLAVYDYVIEQLQEIVDEK